MTKYIQNKTEVSAIQYDCENAEEVAKFVGKGLFERTLGKL